MSIRHASAADIPVLMELDWHAATGAHWSVAQYQAIFAGDAPSRVVLIIEQNVGVQGFIVGKVLDHDWEIENIAVAEPARRRGLGTRLVGEFLDLARNSGGDKVFLEVRESNFAARRLYEKWAFVGSGRRKRYYRDPEEDAIAYQMQLCEIASDLVHPVRNH
jgi:[ribosomal protein S18]-alanine N-acetyltransferase